MKLDLCSGTAAPERKAAGYVTMDIRKFPGVDYAFDLASGERWPFEDNAFEFIRAADALEHIRGELFSLFDEAWRVTAPGGIFEVTVPRFPSANAVMHLDHHRFFLAEDDYAKFAAALAPLLNGEVNHLFHVHSWSFFMVPADGRDVHGYCKRFWHLSRSAVSETHLTAAFTPNKPGGPFPYKEVKPRYEGK